ncbi:N-acetylmuramidase domain-containing protein [Roseibium porphyridii]|uniref:N-acetylmuramidase domain-containing protein n=1 Tax=Roseibium porphyridii TaxID=2866279 RepID=A0ABY8FCC4_9HYPH|nr:N-acetylmuramidase domain-containing protein [Roseibium sp. KMA01]WFE92289.1 N-acetylmuramidase domain-containing protein [Roseibium sp. KMA01]
MSTIIKKLRQGGGQPSDGSVISLAAARMECEEAILHAILEVEAKGRAFDNEGRLIILPEKHVFWRELPKALRAKAKRLGLAVRKWSRANYKGLGSSGSDARWDQLEAMARLHETAGLRSASYGGPQIMGFNAELCGYPTVQEFVLALAETEAAQAEAFLTYLEKVGLLQAIRDRDWRAIARRYNGPGQVTRYAGMMKSAYERITKKSGRGVGFNSSLLRLGSDGYRVKALQERLVALGYHVKPDGDFGPATRRQVVAFQVDNGLSPDGVVGQKTSEQLESAVPINSQPGGTRDNLTVKDLRTSGSQTIKQADRLTGLGVGALVTGGAATVIEEIGGAAGIETLKGLSNSIQQVSALIEPVFQLIGNNKWLALVAIGVAVFMLARNIKLRRLHDAREWRHVG